MNETYELTQARAHADTVIRVARTYHYDLPDGWDEADTTRREAVAVASQPKPVMPVELPKPGKVEAWCTKHATEAARWRERVEIARDLAGRADLNSIRIALDYADTVAARLSEQVNADLIPRFRELLETAPRTLTGYETTEQMTAHGDLLRCVSDLSRAALDRGGLAVALDEGQALGRDGALFLLIDPFSVAETVTVRGIEAAMLEANAEGMPNTLDRWVTLASLGLSFANPNIGGQRLDAVRNARRALVNTPDGGMHDHTLADLTRVGSNQNADHERAQRFRGGVVAA